MNCDNGEYLLFLRFFKTWDMRIYSQHIRSWPTIQISYFGKIQKGQIILT
jgi:hypothetical protein